MRASSSSHSAADATSAGSAIVRKGCRSAAAVRFASLPIRRSASGVAVRVGATALTRMRGASSAASDRVRPFHRALRTRDRGVKRQPGPDGDRAEQHDAGGLRRLQRLHRTLQRPHCTEQIDLEIFRPLLLGKSLEGAQPDGAGTIDEPVECRRQRVAGEVVRSDVPVQTGDRRVIRRSFRPTRQLNHSMAALEQHPEQRGADAGRAADDQIGFRHFEPHEMD
jgi:hypothetical protein